MTCSQCGEDTSSVSNGNACPNCGYRDNRLAFIGANEIRHSRPWPIVATAIAGGTVFIFGLLINMWLKADSDNGMIFWIYPLVLIWFVMNMLLATLPLWWLPSLAESWMIHKILISDRLQLRHVVIVNLWTLIATGLFAVGSSWLAQVDLPETDLINLSFDNIVLPGLALALGAIPVFWSICIFILAHNLKTHKRVAFISMLLVAIISLTTIATQFGNASYAHSYRQCKESFSRQYPDGIGYISCYTAGYHITIGDKVAAEKRFQERMEQDQIARSDARLKQEQQPTEAEKRAAEVAAIQFTPYGLDARDEVQNTRSTKAYLSMLSPYAKGTTAGWIVSFQVPYERDPTNDKMAYYFGLYEVRKAAITSACPGGQFPLDIGPCELATTTPNGIQVYQKKKYTNGPYYFIKDGIFIMLHINYAIVGSEGILQYAVPYIDKLHAL